MEAHVTEIAVQPLEQASTEASAVPIHAVEDVSIAAKTKIGGKRRFSFKFTSLFTTPKKRRQVVYVSHTIVSTSPRDEAVENVIDYASGVGVLARARGVDEVEPPLGGTPFGA